MNNYNECDDYLAHHGVKGMKWGIRRNSRSGGSRIGSGHRSLNRKAAEKNGLDSILPSKQYAKKYLGHPIKRAAERSTNLTIYASKINAIGSMASTGVYNTRAHIEGEARASILVNGLGGYAGTGLGLRAQTKMAQWYLDKKGVKYTKNANNSYNMLLG